MCSFVFRNNAYSCGRAAMWSHTQLKYKYNRRYIDENVQTLVCRRWCFRLCKSMRGHLMSERANKKKASTKCRNVMRILPFFGGVFRTPHFMPFRNQMHTQFSRCVLGNGFSSISRSLRARCFLFSIFLLFYLVLFISRCFSLYSFFLRQSSVCVDCVHLFFLCRTDGFCYGGWLHKTLLFKWSLFVSYCTNEIRQTKCAYYSFSLDVIVHVNFAWTSTSFISFVFYSV